MRMRNLEDYNIPSCFVDILEKNYSLYLLLVQKKAVKDFGILDYNDGKMRLPYSSTTHKVRKLDSFFHINDRKIAENEINKACDEIVAPPAVTGNDRDELRFQGAGKNGNHNLLVIAPPSSGKTLIGEMAVITRAIHEQKSLYLSPFPFMAEDKYHHFRKLYTSLGLDILISYQTRKEDDQKIVKGDYDLAVIVYEKFNHFLLKHPEFLNKVSLLIIDEMQMINDIRKGPLLKSMIEIIRHRKPGLKIIALSAFTENLSSLKKILSAQLLTSFQHPIELRKGIVREGLFKYIEHNTKKTGKEIFFKANAVRDNFLEDYLKETVNYFIQKNESTLLLFSTCPEARERAFYLSSHLKGDKANNQAIDKFYQIKDTLSRKGLLNLLEKGIVYYNSDLSWKEKNLIKTYFKKGKIKVICATFTLSMELNLNFKNVILALNKLSKEKEYSQNNYQKSLSLIDIENIGGKAGILNKNLGKSGKKEEFGRLIFLAHNKLKETIFNNLYFSPIARYRQQEEERFLENYLNYNSSLNSPLSDPLPGSLQPAARPLQPVLEIDKHRPDRIIFMGKKIEVTAKEFSLLYLLAQHNGKVVSYKDISEKLWKEDDDDAIYTRIIQHIYKFRKNILDTIGNNKINKEKVKDILKVISGRGVMLNINDMEMKIN